MRICKYKIKVNAKVVLTNLKCKMVKCTGNQNSINSDCLRAPEAIVCLKAHRTLI